MELYIIIPICLHDSA